MTDLYVLAWAKAFALTLGIECLVAVPLLARFARASARPTFMRRLLAVWFGNLASHPAVWFVFPALLRGTAELSVQESWAVLVEAALYGLVFPASGFRSALAVSALANAVSLSLGLVLRAWTGWV